jgi:hypothetical protein
LADNLRHSLVAEHRSVSLGRGLARMEPTGRDTLLAFSAAPGEEAEDGAGRNSPFASALLRHMPEPGVEVSVMLKQVSAEVRQATNSAQRPQQLSDMAEPFYFVGARSAEAARPHAAAPDHSVELAFFQTAVAANDCAAIRSYLTRYPNGIFVDLAKLAEQRLCSGPARHPESEDQARAAPAKSTTSSQPIDTGGSGASPQPAQSIKRMAPTPVGAVMPPPDAAAPGKPAAPELVETAAPGATPPPPVSDKRRAPGPVVAATPPADAQAPAPSPADAASRLQTELMRVGCGGPDLTANGDWDDESKAALAQFNRFAKTSYTEPSEAAIAAVHAHDGPVCPLLCGEGRRALGDTCVAEPEPHPRAKKEAERPRSKSRKSDERVSSRPPRRRETVRSRPESASRDSGAPHLNAFEGSTSPISGPHGMKCYTLDEVGLAPRIVCN